MGLIKSIEKFKPQAGCRFATYAYWWIRQTVRKAIFQHSRTIRLPVILLFSYSFYLQQEIKMNSLLKSFLFAGECVWASDQGNGSEEILCSRGKLSSKQRTYC